MKKILIIEDEKRIAHWVREYFEQNGFQAMVASDGRTGLHLARNEHPELIILDLMLPEMDGKDVCKAIRRESDVPIIMLTARSSEIDRIMGLELGADDYVVKPFSPGELIARARAVLRRTQGALRSTDTLQHGEIHLDLAAHTCAVRGQQVRLSRTQFDLLAALMQNKGRVLSRAQLLEAAFEGDYDGFDRTIDVHIRRLRKQIELDPSNPEHIVTVFGVGYKFSA
jgi:two-component system alkaline phosphatase synthesis response regulator PhoP